MHAAHVIGQAVGGRSLTFNAFTYDEAGKVLTQELADGGASSTTVYIGGLYEKVSTGTVTEHKHYIRAEGKLVAIRTKTAAATEMNYVHCDHLGSIEVLSDSNGEAVNNGSLSYDAWGKRRDFQTWGALTTNPADITNLGFTGHLHLDALGLIHMQGRIYDPALGRFISPDPIVQAPENAQSLNRYTYCMNNPLSLTDPSGYISWRNLLKSFVSTVIAAVVTAPLTPVLHLAAKFSSKTLILAL